MKDSCSVEQLLMCGWKVIGPQLMIMLNKGTSGGVQVDHVCMSMSTCSLLSQSLALKASSGILSPCQQLLYMHGQVHVIVPPF